MPAQAAAGAALSRSTAALADELPSFKEFLLAAPDLAELEIDRPPERARVVELAAQADDTP